MYYGGGILGSTNYGVTITTRGPGGVNALGIDPVYYGNRYIFTDPYSGIDLVYRCTYQTGYERTVSLSRNPILHVDPTHWTGYFKLANPADTQLLQTNDIILTSMLHYQDQFSSMQAATYPVGFIQRIDHDTVRLRNMAYGIRDGMRLALWSDYYVMATALFTGDIAAGSNTITHVQGRFPMVGERLDIPMLANGSFVTGIDTAKRMIHFSTSNTSGRSFSDYTFINGYPQIEMHSCYDLPTLVKYHKTLVGGSTFYLHPLVNPGIHEASYLLGATIIGRFRNDHTIIGGDTTWHSLQFEPATGP
jgi:hypothetical protein